MKNLTLMMNPKPENKTSSLPNLEWLAMQRLALGFMWIAPVGVRELRGFMVCRRVMNNPDGPNTRVDYLRVDAAPGQSVWKKPFRECEHLFPTLDAAMRAALERVSESQPNPTTGTAGKSAHITA